MTHGVVKIQKPISNSNLAKIGSPIPGTSIVKPFPNFAKEHGSISNVLVQDVKTICVLSYELWAEDVPWDLSLTCVLEGFVYCNNP